jgi:hypothetical protein
MQGSKKFYRLCTYRWQQVGTNRLPRHIAMFVLFLLMFGMNSHLLIVRGDLHFLRLVVWELETDSKLCRCIVDLMRVEDVKILQYCFKKTITK